MSHLKKAASQVNAGEVGNPVGQGAKDVSWLRKKVRFKIELMRAHNKEEGNNRQLGNDWGPRN